MPEEQVTIAPTAPAQIQLPPNEPDLLTKVTQYKSVEPQTPAPDNQVDIGFDYKEIESIADPKAKEIAIKAYKSMQSGATKKYQEIAQIRKDLEVKLQNETNWTPERIQKELNNPQFIQAAQKVAETMQNPQNSGLTNEEFSALSDREKAEIVMLKNEVNSLKQANNHAFISQHDAQLKSKYSDYDAKVIDDTLAKLATAQPHELREWIYKAVLHDTHVKNAYEMAKQEKLQLNQERVNGLSPTGLNANTNDAFVREKNESPQQFLQRIMQGRLQMAKAK